MSSHYPYRSQIVIVGAGKQGQRYHDLILGSWLVSYRGNWQQCIDDGEFAHKPSGVIIATQPDTHIEIAEFCLRRDIPVMIEKPLALSSIEAKRLEKYDQNKILINHVHLFSDSYQSVKMKLPNPITLTIKIGGDVYRKEYSRLWDYGSHGVALALDYMMKNDFPVSVRNDLDSIYLDFDLGRSAIINIPKNKIVELVAQQNDIGCIYNNDPQCLQSAIKIFQGIIDGQPDLRSGSALGIKVLEVLEKCHQ